MPWIAHHTAPIARFDAAPRSPALRIFTGKPHALAFLADGSLVIGGSRHLTLHDPTAFASPRATLAVRGTEWMVAHPDGESVVAVVREPVGRAVVRVWPATGRVVTLVPAPLHDNFFCGALAPDGARLYVRRIGDGPKRPYVLWIVDALTGATLGELALPDEANRASGLAVRPDGAVYVPGKNMLIVHPDGRVEPRDDYPFFHVPEPLFVAADGGMIGDRGQRIVYNGGKFESLGDMARRVDGGTISHDRTRLTFHGSCDRVQVWDVAGEQIVFTAEQGGASGQIPNWKGQSAAASATHVAAIDYRDASVMIWSIDQPAQPIATLTGYSQGARRLMIHGGAITVHTLQPPNTLDSVMEIDLASGATKLLKRDEVHDIARTPDGQRLIVLHEAAPLDPLAISVLDPAGEVVESLKVERGAGELGLAPGGATWGVVSHTYPSDRRADPTNVAQWRAFGATKWAKNLKLKGRWQGLALGDTAAAVIVGAELAVVAFAKGKSLLTTTLPELAFRVAISPEGTFVAVVCRDKPRLVRVATGAVVELAPALPGEELTAASVCVTSEWLFLGHQSGAITQHRIPSGEQVALLEGHTDQVDALTWADGALWSGSSDGTIVRWGDLG